MNSLTENREPISASPYSDEIDLFELIADLWKEKWVIISTTLIAGVIAVAYALLATPIYQSQAEVLPPYVSQITALNKGILDSNNEEIFLRSISVDKAYSYYISVLTSKEYKALFINSLINDSYKESAINIVGSIDVQKAEHALIARGSKYENLSELEKLYPVKYRITARSDEPLLVQDVLSKYVQFAGEIAKKNIIIERQAEIQNIIRDVEATIKTYQKQIDLAQKAEIKELKEGLYIAEKLGIESPMTPEGKATKEGAAYVDQNLLYMRGSKALTAQIEVLEKRGIDVLLLPELRELTVKHEFFRSIEFDEDKISLYNLDAPAELPEKPIKPKKKLVVLIGGLVGFMLGGMIALVRIAMRNRKQTGLN